MKVLVEGHKYELESMNGGQPQVLQFIEKAPDSEGVFRTVTDGTTNEEVLKMLIDRTEALQKKAPSAFNELAISRMKDALFCFERRTSDRKARGVEGTAKV